ncbi:ABC transporter permease [Cellulomonas sp. APG4]|uniref:ABC transporter permease n=1 Tax=Cellulomonas sp. APG4 TaxID=1538656 RepID=UPI00137A5D1B|nr:ABC transporter permease [Cellulomonas sp. APG4]NCT91762.1 ABC transporter permease [Cellulomonas sp. APG4]
MSATAPTTTPVAPPTEALAVDASPANPWGRARLLVALRRVVGRVVAAVLVLLGAATVVFLAQTLLPGDRATLLLNLRSGEAVERTAAELAPINEQYGFDDPLAVQYATYVGGLLRGDLGVSYQRHAPVAEVIGGQLWPTAQLALGALAAAWVLALVSVVVTAGRRSRAVTAAGSGAEALAASVPHYWLGVILLVVLAVNLQWFPVMGGTSPAATVLPVLTLAVPLAGFLGQATRDEFDRVLEQPFVTSARARGMGDTGVRLRHVLRHAVLPAITLSGWALGALLSGAVIVESVFSRPGLGQVLVAAVDARDVPVVAGVVMFVAAVYVVANVLVDLAYTLVDPRRRS